MPRTGYNFVLPHFIRRLRRARGMTAEESELLRLINGARIGQGGCAGGLSVDPRLVDVARAHSQDLAAHPGLWEKRNPQGYPGHYGSDGSLPSDRIASAVGSPGTENVLRIRIRGTAAPPTAETAFNEWMKSPPHKANLMNCNHRTTGVGIATGQDPDGWTAYYFTQVFHP